MNMNRIADAVKKDPAMKSSLMDMAGRESVQADSDWDNQSNAFGTHPGLFGQVPLYPGLLQKKSRAGSLPPTPPAANPNLQADALQLDGEGIDALQLDGEEGAGRTGRIHEVAASGIQGAGGALPHLDSIQKSFGKHDVSSVQAHTDQHAKDANQALGANAYATGSHVALDDTSLHTVAHEAAHVVQQRNGIQLSGGVGKTGDQYEQHADQVADLVVQGKSAEHLLNRFGGGGDSAVQMDEDQGKEQEEEEETAPTTDSANDSGKDSGTQAKMSGSRNGLLQLDASDDEEEEDESAPSSAVAENPTQAKAIDAGNGLIQLEAAEEEEKKEEDAAPSSASEDSATQAKASTGSTGLLQLDSKDDADAAASSDAPAPTGKKKPPVKPAQALSQVKSTPSQTPVEAPADEQKTGAGAEAVIVRPMVESKEDDDTASATAPEATGPTQAKSKNLQLDKKPASKEGSKSKVGFTPPKMMWNGLTFEGIEGDINREFYKPELKKKKLFKVGHYWPFPAFPFAGIDTAAGADIQPEIAVVAKGTYKWNPVEAKYEFKGSFEASAAVTLTLWARGGVAINLVIQSGGVGLEASSSIEAKAAASAAAGFKLDGKTGAMEGDVGLNLDIGATWKAALALAVWTEGWFYDDIWKYTFAEMTIGTLTGFKMNAGWKSGQGFSWGVDPSSGTFNWGAAPDNPQK